MNDAAWAEQRKHGISASEVPAVLGISPYLTPIDIYRRKVLGPGPAQTKPEAPWLKWGRLLEPVIANAYAEETRRRLRKVPKPISHPQYKIIMGTPDRLVMGESGGVECKSAGSYAAKDQFGEPGTDEIPDHYLVQVMIYLAITGREWWDLPVLVGGHDFRIYTVRRNRQLENEIIDRVRAWWEAHIVKRVEPDMDWADESTSVYLAAKYPNNDGEIIVADPTAEVYGQALAISRSELKKTEQDKAALENHLKNLIGTADGMSGAFGKISWRKTKESEATDWKAIAQALLASMPKRKVLALTKSHTQPKPGARRFLFTPAGGLS